MTSALTSARNAYAQARPFALTMLVGAAALTIALAGARAIADIVGPVFLALVLTISLHPIRIWLERHRLPEVVASIVLLLAAYLVLGLLTLALIVSVAQLAELLPQYEEQLTAVVADAGNTLRSLGVQQEQINAVVKAIDPGQLVAVAGAVLASTLGVLSNVFFLIVLLFFMAFDTDSTRRSLAALGERMPDLAAAFPASRAAPATTWASRQGSDSSLRSSTAWPWRLWACRGRSCGPCWPSSPTSSPTSASSSE